MKKQIYPSEVIKDIKYNDLKGMNAVFINMPIRENAAPTTTPQGPLLLATQLRDVYGVNVSVLDLNGYRIRDNIAKQMGLPAGRHVSEGEAYDLLERHFETYGTPDLVGLSGIITTLDWQEKISKAVRRVSPESFLVSGGGLATELGTGLFNYIPALHGVASGEGDNIIGEIASDARRHTKRLNGRDAERRKHLVYSGGSPSNLDIIPFADLGLLDNDTVDNAVLDFYLGNAVWGGLSNNSSVTPFNMVQSTTTVSSRGCPHSCDFCYTGVQGGRFYNMRSAIDVAAEVKMHKRKYNIDFIGFPDDNFGINRKRIKELIPLLQPLGVKWGTHIRLDEAADIKSVSANGQITFENPRKIDMMAEAGCIYVGFGAESASPRVLESMKKGGFILKHGLEEVKVDGKNYSFPRSMIHGIRNSEDVGIHANCTWIMGYPEEGLEDLKQSVAFIKWQEEFYATKGKADSVNKGMFTATAYPGTPMFSRPDVMKKLSKNFKIKFGADKRPVCDENFRQYILGLEDATKVLTDVNGNPLNYSDMDDKTFLKARRYIDDGDLEKVLAM